MATPPALKLLYFDFPGRAQYIREACVVGNIPFEDEFVQGREHLKELKANGTLPFGQVPVLYVDGELFTAQSNAILRYVGRMAGLYPEDPQQALKVDEAMDTADDMIMPIVATVNPAGFGRPFASDDEKLAVRARLAEDVLPQKLAHMEAYLEKTGTGWCVGDSVTVADLKWVTHLKHISKGILDGVPATILDSFPRIKELVAKVDAIPQLVEWNAREAERKAAKRAAQA